MIMFVLLMIITYKIFPCKITKFFPVKMFFVIKIFIDKRPIFDDKKIFVTENRNLPVKVLITKAFAIN